MTLHNGHRPRQANHLMEYQVEDELTLYDHRANVVHILNSTAAAVWELADGTQEAGNIAAQLAELYGLEADVAEEDVQEILEQFREAGLLQNRGGLSGLR